MRPKGSVGILAPSRYGVEGEVRGDPVKPRTHLRLAAEVRQRPIGAHKRLLGNVLGEDRVPHNSQCRSEYEVLMSSHELAKRFEVARRRLDEVSIGDPLVSRAMSC